MSKGISAATLERYRSNFEGEPRYRLARNACTKQNPMDVCRQREVEETASHFFTHKVDEIKPLCNQRSSGRCWIFACMNCMRLPTAKLFNVEEFEFSQSYLFFWDKVMACHLLGAKPLPEPVLTMPLPTSKLFCVEEFVFSLSYPFWDKVERMNFLMHAYVDTARAGEAADGRLLYQLTLHPMEDGGQWAMLVNLVEKYGVMPKKCFPDTWSSENSRKMGEIINSKMREYCMRLRTMVEDGKTEAEIEAAIDGYVEEVYRICSICLGTPPKTFTWEYYNKDKEYHKVGPITPRDFYHQHIKTVFNMEDKVCFVNDPRADNAYNKLYTVDYLGNMTGASPVLYINKDVQVLKDLAQKSIKDNEAVWFGCDVRQHCSWRKHGVEDLKAHDYELLFGLSVLGLSKAERVIYRDSLMTHAMVLTALSEDEAGKTQKWRIENSWGDEGGEKGYLVMTDDWFTEFVYEVVVDKKYVDADTLEILKQTPVVLPAWDPMGALAK